jgi:hypothetical protein
MCVHYEDNSFDEEYNRTQDILIMAINEFSNDETLKHEDHDEEGEVNHEGELICALREL